MQKSIFLLSIFLASCSSINTLNQKDSLNTNEINENINVTKELSLVDIPTFGISDYNNYDNYFKINSLKNDWKYPLRKHPKVVIDNVLLSDTNKSIMTNSIDFLVPDYKGKDIYLTIKIKSKEKDKFNLKDMKFTYDNNLIQSSIVNDNPKNRVVLDDSILLMPIAVSNNEIKVKINSKAIPEFYLKGQHKLSLVSDNYYSDALINIGTPEKTDNLMPKIDSIEVLKDKKGKPINLKLVGKNFMMFYKFSYSRIDGVFAFGHSTDIYEDASNIRWETIIHIPKSDDFIKKTKHTLSYSTPFGTSIKTFDNN